MEAPEAGGESGMAADIPVAGIAVAGIAVPALLVAGIAAAVIMLGDMSAAATLAVVSGMVVVTAEQFVDAGQNGTR